MKGNFEGLHLHVTVKTCHVGDCRDELRHPSLSGFLSLIPHILLRCLMMLQSARHLQRQFFSFSISQLRICRVPNWHSDRPIKQW